MFDSTNNEYSFTEELNYSYLSADCLDEILVVVATNMLLLSVVITLSFATELNEPSCSVLVTQLMRSIVANKRKVNVNFLEYIIDCCLFFYLINLLRRATDELKSYSLQRFE